MSKAKLYKIDNSKRNNKIDLTTLVVSIVVYAVVLLITSSLFEHFYIDGFINALIAACILSVLNYTIKPLLVYWTLPLSIITYGIAYHIVNMIVLKLCDILMGSTFVLTGFFSTFVVAIFISVLRIIFDNMITKRVGRR